MLTPEQIGWARMHDWFVRGYADGTIAVCEVLTDREGNVSQNFFRFTGTFGELLIWAGY